MSTASAASGDSKNPLTEQYTQLGTNFRDAADKIRQRADGSAKTLGALGTTVLTAIGIVKFGDVFPHVPIREDYWVALAIFVVVVSFIVMAAVIGYFTLRLWKLNEPLVQNPDPVLMTISDDERELVKGVYKQHEDLNRIGSLRAYEARAHRLLRIADRTASTAEAERLRSDAADIIVEVRAVQARAALVVIRRRATEVVLSRRSKRFALAFVGAVIAFAISADYLESGRSSEIKVANDCGAAVTAGADKSKLPAICDSYIAGGETDEGKTAAEELSAARIALATSLGACEAAATKAETGAESCAPLRKALLEATAGTQSGGVSPPPQPPPPQSQPPPGPPPPGG